MDGRRENQTRAGLAATLANPLRLALVERLLDGPRVVGELVEAVGAGQAVVSKQLGLLREAGLLRCDPEGRLRHYSLADTPAVRRLLAALADTAHRAAAQAARCRKEQVAAGRGTGRVARTGRRTPPKGGT
ncbi:MAG: winged helix-turn-helix transcriptional regulator [Deltaproteobacteria bacterium]|nr:winged helix-turn-helix transcriptional regulator [Deltaproteobacteria bacterium]